MAHTVALFQVDLESPPIQAPPKLSGPEVEILAIDEGEVRHGSSRCALLDLATMRRNGYSAATSGAPPSVGSAAHRPDVLVVRRDALTVLLGGDDRLPGPEVQGVDPAVVGDLYALITASRAEGRSGVAGGCVETG